MNSNSVWLIEQGVNPCKYLATEIGIYKWTEDVEKAIRFSRKKDAEMIAQIIDDDCDRICNHIWFD
jgi:hypothetical protein